jgi:hypothetical protein
MHVKYDKRNLKLIRLSWSHPNATIYMGKITVTKLLFSYINSSIWEASSPYDSHKGKWRMILKYGLDNSR